MADDQRPDQIEGISTDADGTFGDPELRSANAAPDLSDETRNDRSADQTDPGPTNAEVSDDVNVTGSDLTKGTAQHNPK